MTELVVSITSATVSAGSEAAVVEAYRAATAQLPHMVLNTLLVKGDADEWRIITLWRGPGAVGGVQASGEDTSRGADLHRRRRYADRRRIRRRASGRDRVR